ncbi:FUSC family protein [Marinomonas ostreistagni]|uniref:FUSC family protein n=1 Tax=Marinomonas ostreistagni TaxID=359209 RepID=UPI00194DDD86|nr:FUSC family protein [Marinomonas ostreistagni]MBM6552201.1 FUSC family protein [Marinomonas ostreistagni]
MQALLNSFFSPSRAALQFAIKGILAMALALYVAMFFNLDRPYWALIGAIFLQIRPESGLVIEKGIYQILGTLIGGTVGVILLENFSGEPIIAMACLALWLGVNSGLSALVRRVNLIYAFAMAGMTASLVVLLVMVQPAQASSASIFDIAQARVSEIIVGVVCAALVSTLIWPVKVSTGLRTSARDTINQTLAYLALELDPKGSHEERHQAIDSILESLSVVNDDSTAVRFEGPLGPGRSRASNLLTNKILSLLALVQIFGRLRRKHPELISTRLGEMIDDMYQSFGDIASATTFQDSHALAQALRRRQSQYVSQANDESPLCLRLFKVAQELTADLVVILKSYDALSSEHQPRLNAPRIKPHHDPLVGLTTGLRSAVMFVVGATLWLGTGSSAVLMIMILPVVFSIMMARLPMPILTVVLRRILVGVVIAVILAVFYALPLLAQSTGDFELLVLILAGPYFVGLLCIANRPTLPYGLGIAIPFTIFVMPGPDMSRAFQIDSTMSNALAIFVGITVLYWLFKLITGPSLELMMRRLIRNTRQDLLALPHRRQPDLWFNARMGDRLLRVATYEKGMTSTRNVIDLALTGLNLGHVSLRLHSMIRTRYGSAMDAELDQLQAALAEGFYKSFEGHTTSVFEQAAERFLTQLPKDGLSAEEVELIRGSFERLSMSLDRSRNMIAANQSSNTIS